MNGWRCSAAGFQVQVHQAAPTCTTVSDALCTLFITKIKTLMVQIGIVLLVLVTMSIMLSMCCVLEKWATVQSVVGTSALLVRSFVFFFFFDLDQWQSFNLSKFPTSSGWINKGKITLFWSQSITAALQSVFMFNGTSNHKTTLICTFFVWEKFWIYELSKVDLYWVQKKKSFRCLIYP